LGLGDGGYRLPQRVAYGELGSEDPAVISSTYEQQVDAVIELQLEKASVRLASLLDAALK